MLANWPTARYVTVATCILFVLAFYQFSSLTASDYQISNPQTPNSHTSNAHNPSPHTSGSQTPDLQTTSSATPNSQSPKPQTPNAQAPDSQDSSSSAPFASNGVKVSVIESKGCHDEVSASYMSALGHLPECKSDVFLTAQRFGIESIYELLPGADNRMILNHTEFRADHFESETDGHPDIVLSVTSEYDLIDANLQPTFSYLLHNTSSILFATVHHGNEWKEARRFEAVKPWIAAKRLRFITLSDHVTDYMQDIVKGWATKMEVHNVPISTFPPVFTIPAAPATNDGTLRFAMQGDLVVNRRPNRDYEGTFKRVAMIHSDSQAVEFHVLGNGGLPKVPPEAKELIKFHRGLPYPEFYKVLHSATAMLPAFASPEYVKSKASSTIPASLIVGSPLIADDDLLNAYRFLSRDDVYYREKGEDEIDVVQRIAKMPQEERLAKTEGLRKKNIKLTKLGGDLFRWWIYESRERLT